LLNDKDSGITNVLILVLNPVLREQFVRSFIDNVIHEKITVGYEIKELLYKQNKY
jgi:hypothetical protein